MCGQLRCRYVIWQRIDQKTCLKCINAAGLEALPLQPKQEGDELLLNLKEVEAAIEHVGSDQVR